MKKLAVNKNAECMACLQCVQACSEAFYKENDVTLSCIQIVAKGTGAKPNVCIQCGKCMRMKALHPSALPVASVSRPAPWKSWKLSRSKQFLKAGSLLTAGFSYVKTGKMKNRLVLQNKT